MVERERVIEGEMKQTGRQRERGGRKRERRGERIKKVGHER